MMRPIAALIAGLAVLVLPAQAKENALLEPPEHYGTIAKIIADVLPRIHMSHDHFGDLQARIAFTNYIESLDFDHSVFLQGEVDELAQRADELDDQLEDGHLTFAYEVYQKFLNAMEGRYEHVDALLKKGFDMEIKESYAWKRKDAPFPGTAEERDEIWRKKIKHELVSRLVNKRLQELEAEAKKKAAEKKAAEEKEQAKDAKEEGKKEGAADKPVPKVEKVDNQTPQEAILKRYELYMNTLRGNDAEWVLQTYLNSFTRAYDAHSAYLSPRASEDFEIQMDLKLRGIGALLSTEDGAAKIVRLIKGGPAERDGRLKSGDKIIGVSQGTDGEEVDIMYQPLYKSVRLIRGEIGTTVVLSVIPASDLTGTSKIKIDLVRDEINLEDRAAKSTMHEVKSTSGERSYKIGVIDLPDFYADMGATADGDKEPRSSARDVRRLVEKLIADKADGIMIDLRGNGGGSLPDAVQMAGFFIEDGPIVQVKSNRRVRPLRDPDPNIVYAGPMVVMVNRHSASASEIVAAALQDFGRAIIVGDSKTHGKGSVQSLFPLDRRSPKLGSLKLTTAGFYRIDGGSTQLKGVSPDIIIPSALDVMEVGEEYLPNVLDWSWVKRAEYTANTDLQKTIGELRERSAKRRKADPRFDAYNKMVDRLAERLERTDLSLHFKDRLAIAEKDKEIEDFQREALDAEGEAKLDKDSPDDIILNEGLSILRDLIELYPGI